MQPQYDCVSCKSDKEFKLFTEQFITESLNMKYVSYYLRKKLIQQVIRFFIFTGYLRVWLKYLVINFIMLMCKGTLSHIIQTCASVALKLIRLCMEQNKLIFHPSKTELLYINRDQIAEGRHGPLKSWYRTWGSS